VSTPLSLARFVTVGDAYGVMLGASELDVRSTLGEPEEYAGRGSSIWVYGGRSLQVGFVDGHVALLGIYFRYTPEITVASGIDGIGPISAHTTSADCRVVADALGLSFRPSLYEARLYSLGKASVTFDADDRLDSVQVAHRPSTGEPSSV
jgi:prepilin-type processing-associated H-X9-DG protein